MRATGNVKISRRLALMALVLWATASTEATMLVRYTFDEASSGTTTALNVGGSAGSAANGVFNGSATRTSNTPVAFSLGALNLNPDGGNNDFVGPTTDLAAFDTLSAMTVTTWINVQGNRGAPFNSFYALASDISATTVGFPGWEFYYSPIGGNDSVMKLGFQVGAIGADATANVSASNAWLFVAASWDGSTVKFYSGTANNTISQIGSSLPLSSTMVNNALAMRAGANASDGNDHTPNAFMDDVRIYDTALTMGELAMVVADIPEPGSVMLLGFGAMLLMRRKFCRK